MTLGTTLLSLIRSRVLAQTERCGFPILYTAVYLNFNITLPEKPEDLKEPVFRDQSSTPEAKHLRVRTCIVRKFTHNARLVLVVASAGPCGQTNHA